MIGLDLAKSSFQVHVVDEKGRCAERRTLRPEKVLAFFASQPTTLVVMEACCGAPFLGARDRPAGACHEIDSGRLCEALHQTPEE